MSYIYQASRYNPFRLWSFNAEYKDYSPDAQPVTATGTMVTHYPLAYGLSKATVLSSSHVINYPNQTAFYREGKELQSFSIVANIKPINVGSAGKIKVYSRNLVGFDGLYVDGTKIVFELKFVNSGSVQVSYDLQIRRNVAVVAVYNAKKLSLHIDGEVVDEIELTDEQKSDKFAGSATFTGGGNDDGNQKVAVNALGIYLYEMTPSQITQLHFSSKREFVNSVGIQNQGDDLKTGLPLKGLLLNKTWSTAVDWLEGTLDTVGVEEESIVPISVADVSLAGIWTVTVPVHTLEVTSVFGAWANWDGEGVKIEASYDGVTWETLERFKSIELIKPRNGTVPILPLTLRVSFEANVVNTQAYLESLDFYVLPTGNTSFGDFRTLMYAGTVDAGLDRSICDLSDDWGAAARGSGGESLVGYENNFNFQEGTYSKTIELWIMKTTSETPYVFNQGYEKMYVNGEEKTLSALRPGEWAVVHMTGDALYPAAAAYGKVRVGKVVFYQEKMSDADIARLYSEYTGGTFMAVRDSNNAISVTQSPDEVQIYNYDWSMITSK